MSKTSLLVIIVALIACSCDSSIVYKDFEKTSNLEWLKGESKEFQFDIVDDTSTYDLFIAFRYAQGYHFEKVVMNVTEVTPNSEKVIAHDIKIRNKNGSYIGEGSGDIWDIESPLHRGIELSKGTYSYKISHEMPVDKLHMVMEVGMIVKRN